MTPAGARVPARRRRGACAAPQHVPRNPGLTRFHADGNRLFQEVTR
jgi:hypothetical protein